MAPRLSDVRMAYGAASVIRERISVDSFEADRAPSTGS